MLETVWPFGASEKLCRGNGQVSLERVSQRGVRFPGKGLKGLSRSLSTSLDLSPPLSTSLDLSISSLDLSLHLSRYLSIPQSRELHSQITMLVEQGMKRLMEAFFRGSPPKRSKGDEAAVEPSHGDRNRSDQIALPKGQTSTTKLIHQLQRELRDTKAKLVLSKNALEGMKDDVAEATQLLQIERVAHEEALRAKQAELTEALCKLASLEGVEEELESTEQELEELGQELALKNGELDKVKKELDMTRAVLLAGRTTTASSAGVGLQLQWAACMLKTAQEVAPESSDSEGDSEGNSDWNIREADLALQARDEGSRPEAALQTKAHRSRIPTHIEAPRGAACSAPRSAPRSSLPIERKSADGQGLIKKRIRFGADLLRVLRMFYKSPGECTAEDLQFLKDLIQILENGPQPNNFKKYDSKFQDKWGDFKNREEIFASFRTFYFVNRED